MAETNLGHSDSTDGIQTPTANWDPQSEDSSRVFTPEGDLNTPLYSNLDSNANSEDDESDDLDEVKRFFTSQSSVHQFQPDDDNFKAAEREYVAGLVGEDADQSLSISSRFEGWLGKDVLLQGKIFLTKKYFLFYAHLPTTHEVLKASPLAKKSCRSFQGIGKSSYHRYWFVLRMGAFLWYRDPSDVYFPVGILSLSLMASVKNIPEAPEKFIITSTEGKSYTFKADSRNAAHEWTKALQKEIFRSRNDNTVPAAVVRIPLKNIFYMNVLRPLDIVKLINIQVVLNKTEVDNDKVMANNVQTATDSVESGPTTGNKPTERPVIGRYTFAFFGDTTVTRSIVNRIESSTNDFESQRGINFIKLENRIEIDYENSVFGKTSESVYDTTPPSEFQLFDGREFGDDREILYSNDGLAGESTPSSTSKESEPEPYSQTQSPQLSPSTSHNRTQRFGRTGSRLQSLLPTRSGTPKSTTPRSMTPARTPTNSYNQRSKINILSSLNEKLHKLKTEEIFKPDISVIASAAAIPMKLVPFGDSTDDISENEDGDDSDSDSEFFDTKESDSDGTSKPIKFIDEKIISIPKKLLSVASGDPVSQVKETDAGDGDSLHSPESVELLNKRFREHFGLLANVHLLAEYPCSLRKPGESSSWGGKLLVSNEFLCFNRQNVSDSLWRMVIPLREIIHFKDQPMDSTRLEFEVAETAYSMFRFSFSDPAERKDAAAMIGMIKNELAQREDAADSRQSIKSQSEDSESEFRFIEFSLRSARLSTYEPALTTQLRHRIPPLLFDPTSTQYKEIFLQKPMKSLKFVMLMIGSRGDVQPYIALCQGLMEEGHKCCIVSHKEFRSWVEEFGIEFKEIAGDPRELMEIMISHGSISYGFVKDALSHFKQWLKDLMKTSWKAIKHSNADVLIESPSSMIGIHIAEALNIPYYRAFTMPWTRTKAYPQALIAPDQTRTGTYNTFTYMMYDRLVWFGISKYVNRWRKRHLGLPETDLDLMRQEDIPFLYCVSPTVLVPPLDQPDWVHTCGYWEIRDDKNSKEKEPDPKLLEFIERAKRDKIPLAYLGFGSIIVSDPEAMTSTVVEATKDAGVYCILARGWSSRSTKQKENQGEKEPLNEEHIFEVDSVSHQWLFPQMDVCVHHGGSGTTGASLRSGVPTIIKPFFGDQFFYGRRVEDLGVGFYLKKLTKQGLTNDLKECVSNKQMIRQAKVLGEQIRHEHGVEEAILCIYRELVYAKDVTERRKRMTYEASKTGIFADPRQLLHPAESWLMGDKHKSKENLDDELESYFNSYQAPSPGFRHRSRSNSQTNSAQSNSQSHSWFTLPKFGRREEQRRDRESNDEIDVSV